MNFRTDRSHRLHQAMQIFAAFSLLLFAGLLHLHEVDAYHHWWTFCIWASLAVYPIYWLETIGLWWRGYSSWKRHLLYCLIPPLRLMAPHPVTAEVWLPGIGWTKPSSELLESAEKAFAMPMIVIALMILPVMGIEHVYEARINAVPLYDLGVNVATSLIWLAFTVEFVVMMSLSDRKWKYCIRHWLDLAIIVLPVIAFLRAARLTRLARLQRLTKTARIYRMRGVALKLQRAMMMMSLFKRFLHARPEARLKSLQEKLLEKEDEIRLIREEMAELQHKIALRMGRRDGEQNSLQVAVPESSEAVSGP